MLPGSTAARKQRERSAGKVDGRTYEIQRLVGRALRAVIDLTPIGQRTLWVDCDVIQADGGTRTAAITGAYVALVDALNWMKERKMIAVPPLLTSVAAVSVGVVEGEPMLDLCYAEDVKAEVDMNIVMTGEGEFIEVQGTAEHGTFDEAKLQALLELGKKGVRELLEIQKKALA
jgi:ribonuclease PH